MRNFSELAEAWPSPIVARGRVDEFSGGILNPRTMANIDSDPEIEGPERVSMGRKVGYWKDSLVEFMNRRIVGEGIDEQQTKSVTVEPMRLDKGEAPTINRSIRAKPRPSTDLGLNNEDMNERMSA